MQVSNWLDAPTRQGCEAERAARTPGRHRVQRKSSNFHDTKGIFHHDNFR